MKKHTTQEHANSSWFAKPSVTRLSLPDLAGMDQDQWIEVKHELSAGEQRAAMARTVHSIRADGRIEPNLEQVGVAEVLAYLVDWSLRDEQGKSVPLNESALKALRVDAARAIEDTVRAHVAAVAEAAKKASTGTTSLLV